MVRGDKVVEVFNEVQVFGAARVVRVVWVVQVVDMVQVGQFGQGGLGGHGVQAKHVLALRE